MTTIGYGALTLALAISAYTAIASILGVRRGSTKLAGSAQKGVVASAVLVTLAAAILFYLLITRDFQVQYVYEHVSTYMPTIYVLSAFWAGQEGSLLLWLWLLTIFSVLIALPPVGGGTRGGRTGARSLSPTPCQSWPFARLSSPSCWCWLLIPSPLTPPGRPRVSA